MKKKDKTLPKMTFCGARAAAITYALAPTDHSGWGALCTVNDRTGELLITSDWGNWSHMWSSNPKHLGCATLTDFIGDREAVDYLAGKLNLGNGPRYGEEFDSEETSKRFIGILAKWRLECGREAIGLAQDNEETLDEAERRLDSGPPFFSRTDPLYRDDARRRWFGKDPARRLAGAIKDLGYDCTRSPELYLERLYRIVDHHDAHGLFPDAYEDIVYTQTHADKVLREAILPALIEACRQTSIARALVAANGPQAFPEAA